MVLRDHFGKTSKFGPASPEPSTWQVSESTQAMSEFCVHLDAGSKYQGLPSGYVKIANWKMAIEIVDLPIKHGDFPWLC